MKLYLVVPCYNEEEVLPEASKRLLLKLNSLISRGEISDESRVVFVDDGSKDRTWQLIEELSGDSHIDGIKLSRNRGHQNALLCGLMQVRGMCDVTISLDCDLQDDIEAIDRFITEYKSGCDIVYGVRSNRDSDTAFKRGTAQGFYKILSSMGVEVVYNHADYRLMSARALEALSQYKELNLFLRGIIPLIGFRTSTVEYVRSERFAGESKYPLSKMLKLAFDGITSFSVKPIRMVLFTGIFICGLSLAALLAALIALIWTEPPSFTYWAFSLWFLGGLQLVSVGVIGEYIGKIYGEVKARPRFIVDKTTNGLK